MQQSLYTTIQDFAYKNFIYTTFPRNEKVCADESKEALVVQVLMKDNLGGLTNLTSEIQVEPDDSLTFR